MSGRLISRRRLLAALGATGIFAGCTGSSNEDAESSLITSEKTTGPSDQTEPTPDTDSSGSDTDESGDEQSSNIIYVAPDGNDDNPGSEDEPLETILTAMDRVQPGETIYLKPGEYRGRVVTINEATPENPITLTGHEDAVIRPSETVNEEYYHPITIQHSHYRLTGVTITGLMNPEAPEQLDSFVTRLMKVTPQPDVEEHLEDVVIAPHGIGNSQEALINTARLKNCEFGPFKVIGPAGVEYLYGDEESHVGEILYLGNPLQVYEDGADGYFWDDYDNTRNIHIHHIDNSEGYHHAEIVDCKDGTENVTIEYCTDAGGAQNNDGITSKSILLRGHNCTVRWNRLANGTGNGIQAYKPGQAQTFQEFGFDEEVLDKIATDNEIYGNEIYDFEELAIALDEDTRDAQQHICGNDIRGETVGNPEQQCSEGLPDGDGIGHTGGDSPWS